MKTRYNVFVSAMIGLAALVSCQKELSAPESEGNAFGPGEKMVFKAYASPQSKSHFSESDEGTENQGTLYWNNTDEVGIMSLYLHNRGQEMSSIFDPYWQEIAAGYPDGTFIDRDVGLPRRTGDNGHAVLRQAQGGLVLGAGQRRGGRGRRSVVRLLRGLPDEFCSGTQDCRQGV